MREILNKWSAKTIVHAGTPIAVPVCSFVTDNQSISYGSFCIDRDRELRTYIAPDWNDDFGVVVPNDRLDEVGEIRGADPEGVHPDSDVPGLHSAMG